MTTTDEPLSAGLITISVFCFRLLIALYSSWFRFLETIGKFNRLMSLLKRLIMLITSLSILSSGGDQLDLGIKLGLGGSVMSLALK